MRNAVMIFMMLVLSGLVVVFAGSCRRQQDAPAPLVAASNSMLECAVREIMGGDTPVLRLAEPGACPSHYDVRPSHVDQLRRCRVLLRLDFQKSLDSKISGAADGGSLTIAEVSLTGGLCEPRSYIAACGQAAEALVAAGLVERSVADERLRAVTLRMDELSQRLLRQVEPLAGLRVLASVHQQAFCQWLGLEVTATFAAADTAGVRQLDEAVRRGEHAGVELVVANMPEGRRVADALAERLGAGVVVFGNFPAMTQQQPSFDSLVEANVQSLLETAGK